MGQSSHQSWSSVPLQTSPPPPSNNFPSQHSPVQNPADKRRYERDPSLGARHSLGEGEEQRQVAMDAVLLLQLPRGLDAFPRGGQLDQDTLLADAFLLEHGDELPGFSDAGLLVE